VRSRAADQTVVGEDEFVAAELGFPVTTDPGVIATFEELRAAARRFAVTYNREWLLERHDYRTLAEAREQLLALAQATVGRMLSSPGRSEMP
jgi:hypothetical protein